VCGPDPEPNLRPAPCGMEPAGHPPRKTAQRKHSRLDESNPLSDERVPCVNQTPSLTSSPSRGRRSRQVIHTGKSLRGQNERSPLTHAHWLKVMRKLDQARLLIRRSTTPHPAARSHPRPAFGSRSKGDQPAPGCRLGVEGPKDGGIKEKAERGQVKFGSQTTGNQCVRNLGKSVTGTHERNVARHDTSSVCVKTNKETLTRSGGAWRASRLQ
jgi:hypothetical protein